MTESILDSYNKHSPDVAEFGEVWIEAGELFGQFPDSDDEDKAVEDDDDADGREEAPYEVTVKRKPTAGTKTHKLINQTAGNHSDNTVI